MQLETGEHGMKVKDRAGRAEKEEGQEKGGNDEVGEIVNAWKRRRRWRRAWKSVEVERKEEL